MSDTIIKRVAHGIIERAGASLSSLQIAGNQITATLGEIAAPRARTRQPAQTSAAAPPQRTRQRGRPAGSETERVYAALPATGGIAQTRIAAKVPGVPENRIGMALARLSKAGRATGTKGGVWARAAAPPQPAEADQQQAAA